MRNHSLILKMQSASERHAWNDFIKNYILWCADMGVTPADDAVRLIDSETPEADKKIIAIKMMIEIINLSKKEKFDKCIKK